MNVETKQTEIKVHIFQKNRIVITSHMRKQDTAVDRAVTTRTLETYQNEGMLLISGFTVTFLLCWM